MALALALVLERRPMTFRTFAFYWILLLLPAASAWAAPQTICVYNDAGASQGAVQQALRAIGAAAGGRYNVTSCDGHTLTQTPWETHTALLVVPGGRATPFKAVLGEDGVQRIRAFVEGGGKYLGLCAGGYFGAAHIDFFTGFAPYEIHTDGPLNFYPGTCDGPVWRDFVYNSERGAHAAAIDAWGQTFAIYQNGGGAFVDADAFADITVLARYADTQRAAIVQCPVGLGSAILTGVHPEFDPFSLSANDDYQPGVLPALQADNARRMALLGALLSRLGL